MTRCASDEGRVVALLHDVVEDTPVTFEQLRAEGFSEPVLAALELLTHAPEVPYEDYVRAIADNPLATEAKIADLEDNSDIRRLREIDDWAIARLRKYQAAYQLLIARRDAR